MKERFNEIQHIGLNTYSRTPPHWSHWSHWFFTFILGSPLKGDEITSEAVIWGPKMLTFIDGEPLTAGRLLRGPTVAP